jgi:PleD family two-component response regulator
MTRGARVRASVQAPVGGAGGARAASGQRDGRLRLKSSISVGVAERLPAMPDADALLTLADQALLAAKKAGRNCVRTAG